MAIKYVDKKLGSLNVTECQYRLGDNIEPLKQINQIFVHNIFSQKTPDEVLELHKSKNWAGIGYHFMINKKGTIFYSRPLEIMGSHVYGKNRDSVGIAFFNLDECINSNESINSYKNLIKQLNIIAKKNLYIKSHTIGQLELIKEYQNKLFEEMGNTTKKINFALNETSNNKTIFEKNKKLIENKIKEFNFNELLENQKDTYRQVQELINNLKNCPGEKYYDLAKERI
ncbi:N-acetylmuramoyl-L-alanine amidase [Candidatus Woesearchaeota archaeon]|nr:N-acetylmuramoyl-L-alanine amidase [Candidatus Woesearchaeota archaeon]